MDVLESEVAAIWAGELGVAPVLPESNFFELGGDSLLVLNVVFLVGERYGLELHPAALLDNPKLCEFCRAVELERNRWTG
jgi:polyketide synthase PksJ